MSSHRSSPSNRRDSDEWSIVTSSSADSELFLSCFPRWRRRKPETRRQAASRRAEEEALAVAGPSPDPSTSKEKEKGKTSLARSNSTRRRNEMNEMAVADGNMHLKEASNLIFQHRNSFGSQIMVFDNRWAHLFSVRPILRKLTKGRQEPFEFRDNAEELVKDAEEQIRKVHERRILEGHTDWVPPPLPPTSNGSLSIRRSVARSIRSVRSSISRIRSLYQTSPPYRRKKLEELKYSHPPGNTRPAYDRYAYNRESGMHSHSDAPVPVPASSASGISRIHQSFHRYPPFMAANSPGSQLGSSGNGGGGYHSPLMVGTAALRDPSIDIFSHHDFVLSRSPALSNVPLGTSTTSRDQPYPNRHRRPPVQRGADHSYFVPATAHSTARDAPSISRSSHRARSPSVVPAAVPSAPMRLSSNSVRSRHGSTSEDRTHGHHRRDGSGSLKRWKTEKWPGVNNASRFQEMIT